MMNQLNEKVNFGSKFKVSIMGKDNIKIHLNMSLMLP